MVPRYEYKNVVKGIHLWSVNEHRRKFPLWVARQPPPIKITIKSHVFHVGIINSRMQLQPFKETRRQRQTISQHLITCPLIISNREAFPSSLSARYWSHHLCLDWASCSTTAAKAALREEWHCTNIHTPLTKKSSKHVDLQYLGCSHGSKAIRWAPPKKTPGSLLELNLI